MIIFVYNADSGVVNVALDIAHKLISPSTYNCRLCQMTNGVLKEKQVWKDFRAGATEELLFLHRDEYEKQFEKRFTYPVILKKVGDDLAVLVTHQEMKKMSDVIELIDRLKELLDFSIHDASV